MSWESLLFGLIAVLITYNLHNKINMCAVRASAGVTFILCLLISNFGLTIDTSIYGVIFGASFLGMSSSARFSTWEVIFGTLIFLILAPLMIIHTPPIGGVLGFSAFLSLVFVLMLRLTYRQIFGVHQD